MESLLELPPRQRILNVASGQPAAAGLADAVAHDFHAACAVGIRADDDGHAMALRSGAVDIVQIESGGVGV